MKILSIETSCDETAVSLVETTGDIENPKFKVLGNSLFSQIEIHKQYGGVFPMLAKREHAKNLPPLLKEVLKQSNNFISCDISHDIDKWNKIEEILKKEEGLFKNFKEYFENIRKPELDLIAVTEGPGLEPALWVGISFAKALSLLWNIPVTGINHMEGHIASILIENNDERKVQFPALSLLISGGHTEIVKIDYWGKYKILGQTKDDAVGEAFDKVARMLGLPYPGGPEVSKLAEIGRETNKETSLPQKAKFTRPMIHSNDLNFSFSGLKTAVLYYIRDNVVGTEITEEMKQDICREFEGTVVDVLLNKTKKAIEENVVKTLIIAGGVIANKKIHSEFKNLENENMKVIMPTKALSGDNSLMIASVAYIKYLLNPEIIKQNKDIIAKGNLSLEN